MFILQNHWKSTRLRFLCLFLQFATIMKIPDQFVARNYKKAPLFFFQKTLNHAIVKRKPLRCLIAFTLLWRVSLCVCLPISLSFCLHSFLTLSRLSYFLAKIKLLTFFFPSASMASLRVLDYVNEIEADKSIRDVSVCFVWRRFWCPKKLSWRHLNNVFEKEVKIKKICQWLDFETYFPFYRNYLL